MSNSMIKIEAKKRMVNHYGYAFLTTILLNLAIVGSLTVGLFVGMVLVTGAVTCSYTSFYLSVARGKYDYEGVNSAYNGFRCFLSALWVRLILLGLNWAVLAGFGLLLGVVMAGFAAMGSAGAALIPVMVMVLVVILISGLLILNVRTCFVYHVMCDNKDLSPWQCVKRSFKITKKHFWQMVWFKLSFIGWNILTVMTFGILSLYVKPYKNTAMAIMYDELQSQRPLTVAAKATPTSEPVATDVSQERPANPNVLPQY